MDLVNKHLRTVWEKGKGGKRVMGLKLIVENKRKSLVRLLIIAYAGG